MLGVNFRLEGFPGLILPYAIREELPSIYPLQRLLSLTICPFSLGPTLSFDTPRPYPLKSQRKTPSHVPQSQNLLDASKAYPVLRSDSTKKMHFGRMSRERPLLLGFLEIGKAERSE